MPATAFADLPILPDRSASWDATNADERVRAWAGGEAIDWRKYAKAFLWYDASAPDPDSDGLPDQFGSYKLPFADVVNGELVAVPRGVFAAAAAVQGSQGGVSIPTADMAGVKSDLDRYYSKMAAQFDDDSINPPWMTPTADDSEDKAGRSEIMQVRPFAARSMLIEDMTVRADGDGRTVEAYCAAFNVKAEIRDQDGHYNERNEPGSFTKTINDNGTKFGVFYNHAMTIHGTPADMFSVPIGVPSEAPRADDHGVMTVTRYLNNPLADNILDAIKSKAITAQSYSGRFMRSTRERSSQRGGLPTIIRHEVAMREYGPTPFPAYAQAHIVGTRSAESWMADLLAMEADERNDLFTRMLALATPLLPAGTQPAREVINVLPATPEDEPETTPETEPVTATRTTSTTEAGAAEEPHTHSARQQPNPRQAARLARIQRKEIGP